MYANGPHIHSTLLVMLRLTTDEKLPRRKPELHRIETTNSVPQTVSSSKMSGRIFSRKLIRTYRRAVSLSGSIQEPQDNVPDDTSPNADVEAHLVPTFVDNMRNMLCKSGIFTGWGPCSPWTTWNHKCRRC